MKILRVARYSLLIFIGVTSGSTFITVLIGVNTLSEFPIWQSLIYQSVPLAILATCLFGLMAYRVPENAYLYGISVFLAANILAYISLFLLMRELYIPPDWWLGFILQFSSALIGTFLGANWKKRQNTASEVLPND